jgi:hypothetical protein
MMAEFTHQEQRMNNSLEKILRLIGNVDHTKGNGPNAAIYRGMLLNDIRTIIKTELDGQTQRPDAA